MMNHKCTPISREKIKKLALDFRKQFDVNSLVFPIIEIIDSLHCQELLSFMIISDDDKLLSNDELALYDLNSNVMYIKESVYLEALNGIGRSRFTLTHELSHYLLLYVMKFEVNDTIDEVKPYEDPEWQANYLAGELLAPYDMTKDFTVNDYIEKCLVSEECAIVLWDKRRNGK